MKTVSSQPFISSYFKNQTMQQNKISACFLTLISGLLLLSCNQPANTSDKNENDTAVVIATADAVSVPAYDPAMDSYNVGGDAIKKLGDTLGMKMYEFTARPGESWKLHTHPDHTAYVLQGGKVALFIKEVGRQDTLTFSTGMALLSGPLSDSGKNIGNTTIKMVVTDIYRPRSK
jgi:hypothetical protein